jgi:hypothetical protein
VSIEPTPRLRRDPNPSTASGRKVLIGVAVFFLLLLGFVLTLVFTIGLGNNGVKVPMSVPSHSPVPVVVSPRYFAIDASSRAEAYVSDKVIYRMRRHDERALTAGAAADGRTGYFAVARTGCRTGLETVRAGTAVHTTPIGTIDGRAVSVPIAISPDGTKLAIVLDPRTKQARCTARPELFVYDLRSRVLTPVTGSDNRAPIVSLAWGADDRGGAVRVVNVGASARGLCDRCVAPIGASVGDAQVVLWWHDRFAVIAGGAIRTFSSVGLGATLGSGLPESVTSVSVGPGGTRLLMSAGLQTVAEPGDIRYGTTYIWSDNQATALSGGHWDDPVW